MNKKQMIVLWIGIGIIVLMGLFPPVQRSGTLRSGTYVKYVFILDAYRPVVLSNLITQWVIVTAITGGLLYTFKDKKPKDAQKQ